MRNELENKLFTVTFVIGATASGKTNFINNHFSNNKDTVILNVYDYQQAAYKVAGFDKRVPLGQEFKCLYKANENLLTDIIKELNQGKNVVVEQTLFKAKRRISYIDAIRNAVNNINIEVYVMCPSDSAWEEYITARKLNNTLQQLRTTAKEIEFPNPSEGFDRIYEVTDNDIRLRMDSPKPEILDVARQELQEEFERIHKDEEEKKKRLALIESMNTRPFWHYCEVCDTKIYCTAQEAFNTGWDYPPQVGSFGLLGPRTCGKCNMTDTLFWKVQQQTFPIVLENRLTEQELKTWRRIKKEPESLLEEDI